MRALLYLCVIFVFKIKFLASRHPEPLCPSQQSLTKLIDKVDGIETELKQNTNDLKNIRQQQSGFSPLFGDIPDFYHEKPLTVSQLESNGWKMVFRATSGIGQKAYEAWAKCDGTSNVKPVHMARSLSSHYRDPGINSWSNIQVKYVKLALYKDTREVAFIVLTEVDLQCLTGSRINEYLHLVGRTSLRLGHTTYFPQMNTPVYDFFINVSYNVIDSCAGDRGYLAVIEGVSPSCNWEKQPRYPQFMYSDLNSDDFYDRKQFGRADYLCVFVYV